MAKKITRVQNPLTNGSVSILDPSAWLGGILWVVMFGLIVSMGVKALSVIDGRLPGSQAPNMKPYSQPASEPGYTIL